MNTTTARRQNAWIFFILKSLLVVPPVQRVITDEHERYGESYFSSHGGVDDNHGVHSCRERRGIECNYIEHGYCRRLVPRQDIFWLGYAQSSIQYCSISGKSIIVVGKELVPTHVMDQHFYLHFCRNSGYWRIRY
ncbi:MAG: hypothetical protein PHP43_00090 [Methanoculleus sp.]|jgi:hypothetical protein|nr:hypothetical protein [Methanoculleus sp.]HOI60923.1 hypothetical protein [Methanoculleus sp.]